jgi:MFS family permease
MLGLGFGIFILVYSLIGNVHSQLSAILIFILYGIYAAFTDGNAKAWLTKNANKEDKNTAIGFFNAIQSITIVLASLWTGIIVDIFNYQTAFYISAIGAGVSIVLFLFLKFNNEYSHTSI